MASSGPFQFPLTFPLFLEALGEGESLWPRLPVQNQQSHGCSQPTRDHLHSPNQELYPLMDLQNMNQLPQLTGGSKQCLAFPPLASSFPPTLQVFPTHAFAHIPDKKKRGKSPHFALAQGYVTSDLLPKRLIPFKTGIKETLAACLQRKLLGVN